MGDFAGGTIEAELGLEPVNLRKRFFACGPQGDRIISVQHDFKSRRHGMAGEGSHRRNGMMEDWNGGMLKMSDRALRGWLVSEIHGSIIPGFHHSV